MSAETDKEYRMRPEIAAMNREQYLLYRGRNGGITVTETDLAHARHADNCSVCQDNEKTHHAASDRAERADNARGVLAAGVTNYRQQLEQIRDNARAGAQTLTSLELLDELIEGLRRLSDAGARAWSR